jgi:hypothetical protein
MAPETTTLTSLLTIRKVVTDDPDKAHKVTNPTCLVCPRGRGSICVRGDHYRVPYGHRLDPDSRSGHDRSNCGRSDLGANSTTNRGTHGETDGTAYSEADVETDTATDTATNTATNTSPKHMRRAPESVGIQLLRRRSDLFAAVELLRLLQLHTVVLAVNQRVRRRVQRWSLLSLWRTEWSMLVPRRRAEAPLLLMHVRHGAPVA